MPAKPGTKRSFFFILLVLATSSVAYLAVAYPLASALALFQDAIDLSRLLDALPEVDLVIPLVEPQDVPAPVARLELLPPEMIVERTSGDAPPAAAPGASSTRPTVRSAERWTTGG